MTDDRWHDVRRVFDAVCDLPPETQRIQVYALTTDPDLRSEVMALLEVQTRTLRGGRDALDAALRSALAPELRSGDQLGSWRLLRQIGAGGMGAVFLAERADNLYAQQVAIKLLRGLSDGRAVARLADERRILAGLQHPGIARLYDGGTTPAGQPYLVMEYVDGQPLDAHCSERALGLEARLRLFVRICRAVQAAHARLVVHCDLKPGNVLVRGDDTPVLLDFGIAHLMGEEGGGAAGFCTPAYAAPELLAGEQATIASDVFGLGMLLVELLAMRPVGRRIGDRDRPVPPPSTLAGHDCAWRRRLRGDLDAIATRACALAPEARYGTVESLADDIERHMRHLPVRARDSDRLYRAGRFVRRRWRETGVAVAGVVLASGFVWRLDDARAQAQEEAEVARQVGSFLVTMFEAADPRERGARAADQITVGEVLERAATRIDSELEASPVVRARLQGVIGMSYRNMGDLERAVPLLTSAAEGLAQAGPVQRDEAARILNMLAATHANSRDGDRGERMSRRALALLGPDWPDTFRVAQSYNSLGLSLLAQQRYDEAEAAFNAALVRHEAAGRDQFIGVTLDNLGMLYRRRGDLAAAERVFARSLPLFERMFGPLSFDYWTSHSEYSLLLVDTGRLDDARVAFETNLARAPRIFGEHSIYFSSENVRLGGVLVRMGEYLDAEPVAARAFAVSADVLGPDSFAHSLALALRGSLAEARGDAVRAEADYRRVLAIRESMLHAAHPDTSEAALELGLFLTRSGRDEGAALVRRAATHWLPQVPGDSVNGVRIRHAQAESLLHGDRLDEADRLLAATAVDAARLGPLVDIRQRILEAELRGRRGDAPGAVVAWQRAVDAAVALYGAESAATAVSRVSLAEALRAQRDRDAADGQLALARPVLSRQLVADAPLRLRLEVGSDRS